MSKRNPGDPRQFSQPDPDKPTVYIRHVSGGGRTLTPEEVLAIMAAVLKAVPRIAVEIHETPLPFGTLPARARQ
jgi:hypothetical protein